MNRPQEPTIDAFEFARTGAVCEGEVEIARLPRLAEMLIETDGWLRYRVQGLLDADGNAGTAMHLVATLPLICQRCNQPLAFELDRTTRFRFVHDEQELNALPLDDDDVDFVIGSRAIAVLPWIEDEAILSLPLVPRHADCAPALASETPRVGERRQPFAALAGLLSDAAPGPDAREADAGTDGNDEGKQR